MIYGKESVACPCPATEEIINFEVYETEFS